jgi:hypothetical protein
MKKSVKRARAGLVLNAETVRHLGELDGALLRAVGGEPMNDTLPRTEKPTCRSCPPCPLSTNC